MNTRNSKVMTHISILIYHFLSFKLLLKIVKLVNKFDTKYHLI